MTDRPVSPGPADERAREPRLDACLRSSTEAIFMMTLDGIITAWNPAAERVTGYPAEEIVGHSVAELLPPHRVPYLGGVLERLRNGEALTRYRAVAIRKDGTPIEVTESLWPIRDPSGTVTGAASLTLDQTEEERLRSQLAGIVEAADEAIIGLDPDGIITSWNAAAERMYGYTAAEMIGQSLLTFAPDAAAIRVRQGMLKRLRQGEAPNYYEADACRKDGSIIRVSASVSPILDRSGAVLGAASVVRELTETDRLRAYLAAIVESTDDAIAGLTLDGTITSWNPGAERMYGYPAAEMIGRRAPTIAADPETTRLLEEALSRLRRGEGPNRYEARVRCKGSGVLPVSVSVSPVRDRSGEVTGAATVARELTGTERLRARLAAIVESSSDAILGLALDGTITSWNPGATHMYGYTADEIIGHSLAELLPEELRGDLPPLLELIRQGRPLKEYETQALCKDGTALDVSVSVSAIRDGSGRVTGAASVARDVSGRKRAEAEGHAARERAQEAERLEAVGRLAGRVAHDFNNLLSGVMGYAGLVAEAATGDIRADAEQILASAQTAARLARELLLFSQRAPAQRETLDLNRVLAEARPLLSASAGGRVVVRFETAPVPPVLADRGQLQQVLLSLTDNARDAMPDGGTLTFATRRDAAPCDPVPGRRYVSLTVTDTGCGMSPEVARRAFEPFFTTKPPGEATGLGLSTVHGIVTQGGGTIGVESQQGRGTTVHVCLPAAAVPVPAGEPATGGPAAAGAPAPGNPPQGSGERVLVVDDEPSVLAATARILRRNGYGTLQAGTAEEALALISAEDIHLMLTDVVMPGMSGAALAERARELKPGLRIVHMSGYRPSGLAGHQADFLPKPFTAGELLGKVHGVLHDGSADDGPGQLSRSALQSSQGVNGRAGLLGGVMGNGRAGPGTPDGRELRSRLAAIVQSAPSPIVGTDLDRFITSWNPGAERLYGYPADEVIGRRLDEIVTPGEVPGLPALFERIGRGETLIRYPGAIARKHGPPAEVLLTIWPVRDDSGTVTGTAAVTQDLAEEDRLRAYLTAIVESADEAIIGTDFSGIITSWNRGAERISGYPADEIIGHSVQELTADGTPDPLVLLERLQRGEELPDIEGQIRRRDGTTADLSLSLSPIRDRGGTIIGIAAVGGEPTETDRLRAQLAAIVDSSSDAIIGLTLDGTITSWNSGAERMYGYPAAEMTGQRLQKLALDADAAGRMTHALRQLPHRAGPHRYDATARRKDGSALPISVSLSAIRDRRGAVTGAASVSRELTEADRLRAQLAAIVESSPDAITGLALDGTITSWNHGAERMYGFTAGEMIGRNIAEIAAADAPDPKAVARQLRPGAGARQFETKIVRKDGTVADVAVTVSPIQDRSGAITATAATGRELTEEDQLRAHLATIVESSSDAIIGMALDGTITSWNHGAERVFGYTAAEIIGHSALMEVDAPLAARTRAVLDQLRRGEGPQRYEARVRHRDGKTIAISASVSPVRDRTGGVVGASTVARELTETEQLRSQLAAIADSSSEAIIGLDLDGRITSWNHGAEQMYGYTADEMTGCSVMKLVPPGEQHDTESLAARLRRGEHVRNYETRSRCKDGTIAHALTSMSAIRDRSGEMTGTALVSRDISDRVRAEQERRAAEERQRQAERIETVSQLAGRVAHDFNNLLSTIMGYGGLVADAHPDSPDIQADVGQILDAARRASRLSRDLLLISRRDPVRVEQLDLNRVLAELRGLLAASIGEHITLRFDTGEVPPVLADSGQLEQVILNLAVNARDAMPDGGTLTFTTGTAAGGQPPGGRGPVPCAELAVTDTGSGMSPEVASRAFEPFFTTKPPDEGTGLGLSTVHSLVTETGGTITVESDEGTGTTFRICLPAARAPSRAEPAGASATAQGGQPGRGRGERVLVVDDEPTVLEAATRILCRNGYVTLKAGTAEEALALLAAHDVELMLTDSVMPGMPGITLAEHAGQLRPGIRILHMSGYLPPGLAGEPVHFLPKPFTAAALLGKVREVLDAPPAAGQAAGTGTQPPGSPHN